MHSRFALRAARARAVGRLVLWAWFPVSVVMVAMLMVSHVLALPTPPVRAVEAALVREGIPRGGWRVYHVLYADCPCSRRIGESLASRGASADLAETVLLVGRDSELEPRLAAAQFPVDSLTAEALKSRFGVEAAPVLFAVGPDGSVRYLGGYSTRKQGPAEDARILAEVLHGGRPVPLPVFGCAVSRDLQRQADPLGLKYSREAAP